MFAEYEYNIKMYYRYTSFWTLIPDNDICWNIDKGGSIVNLEISMSDGLGR